MMPLPAFALMENNQPATVSLHRQLAQVLYSVTTGARDPFELAMHRLLEDVREQLAQGQLDMMSYNAVMGTAVDVLFFFNYDPITLAYEEPGWYRASLIHQIGHGMLQALERFRPDLVSKPFFQEAVIGFAIGAPSPSMGALTCRPWVEAALG